MAEMKPKITNKGKLVNSRVSIKAKKYLDPSHLLPNFLSHQKTLDLKTHWNIAGITMNPTDSSTKPPDSSTNPSESSTNPSDSSIILSEDDVAAVPLIPINRKTQKPPLVGDVVTEDDLPEDKDSDVARKEVDDSMKSPRPTLYEHIDAPGGLVYWKPHVEGIPVPEEGKYYDTIEEAINMYGKYAEAGGFQIKKAGQRLTKSGIVQLKYIMCNKEGAPRHINIDTLDAKHSDKQKRNTTMHVTGCKARIRLELDTVSQKYKIVLRTIEDGSVVCTCRHFARYGFLCRHIFCVFKNRDINVIPKQYILRRWTRDIIPPDLRRKRNSDMGKIVEVERLTNEATCLVDDCLFRLSNNVEKMGAFIEKLKTLKTEVEAEVPNPPSTGDVTAKHFVISKPKNKTVNNPTRASKKGNITEQNAIKRRNSEKEKALGVKKKQKKPCGYCGEKTNLHTKTTCPKNPKAKKKPNPIDV
ncbi:FAR1 DNA binding domain-containing protein [Artemisia annua]|uniref:FAR1 DNA binding domain-containing protein n=1 Tax=Artemisia annua TaxID=35608 RepID=A0A2U1KYB8_ARTAN|nr:FAR1 DNA binding domain-containing protein [Artemisia annua]